MTFWHLWAICYGTFTVLFVCLCAATDNWGEGENIIPGLTLGTAIISLPPTVVVYAIIDLWRIYS